jgi:glycolate oxidase iron-sulfur subunit
MNTRRIVRELAEIVVSGNPGCVLQLGAGVRRRGMSVRVAHPVKLLAWSFDAGAGRGA